VRGKTIAWTAAVALVVVVAYDMAKARGVNVGSVTGKR
jgi:hypothetical protein